MKIFAIAACFLIVLTTMSRSTTCSAVVSGTATSTHYKNERLMAAMSKTASAKHISRGNRNSDLRRDLQLSENCTTAVEIFSADPTILGAVEEIQAAQASEDLFTNYCTTNDDLSEIDCALDYSVYYRGDYKDRCEELGGTMKQDQTTVMECTYEGGRMRMQFDGESCYPAECLDEDTGDITAVTEQNTAALMEQELKAQGLPVTCSIDVGVDGTSATASGGITITATTISNFLLAVGITSQVFLSSFR